jgi:hypothetical protein
MIISLLVLTNFLSKRCDGDATFISIESRRIFKKGTTLLQVLEEGLTFASPPRGIIDVACSAFPVSTITHSIKHHSVELQ